MPSPPNVSHADLARLLSDLARLGRQLQDHDPKERLAICAALFTMAVAGTQGDDSNFVQLGAAAGCLGIAGRASGEQLGDLASALLKDILSRDFGTAGDGPQV